MAQLEVWFHAQLKEVQYSVAELPHAREFLQFCRDRRLKTFLLSSVHRDHYGAQSESIGFDQFIDRPYVEAWDKRAKIHEILRENELDTAETLFIGDMQHDIETAKHGGIHSCAVLTGYNSVAQLRAAQPDLIVEHLGELQQILERNRLELRPPEKGLPGAEKLQPVVTVVALIFNAKGEALLVQTHKWSNLWGIPGGKTRF